MSEYRFSYGRAVYSGVLKDLQISLPVDANGNPDWQYMEDYIKEIVNDVKREIYRTHL